MIHPRGDIPVDGAHFITGLILADLFEVHPLSFEDTVILARQRLGDEPAGADFNLANFLKDFARNHATQAECGMENGECVAECSANATCTRPVAA